ncbi:unnamed protein product, partial [Phaeothamnion confervicola]
RQKLNERCWRDTLATPLASSTATRWSRPSGACETVALALCWHRRIPSTGIFHSIPPLLASLAFDWETHENRFRFSLPRGSYSFSTLAALIRLLNGGNQTVASEGLDKLYGEISMSRCAFRLFGTTDALEALKNDSWAGDWQDPKVKQIARIQALAMVVYHPMEHVGWAAYVTPKLVRADGDWWFSRADWTWILYIVIDMYACLLKRREIVRREAEARRKLVMLHADADDKEAKAALQTELDMLARACFVVRLQWWRDVFYLPNAVHWGFYKPPMNKGLVAVLGLAEALVGLRQTWPHT